jgi:NADH:ubiquinone oxidoreductase subunit 6 (subunit J)
MAEVLFFIAAIGAVAGAVGTVALRNPFFAVLALVCHLLALAALFLLLRAEFAAAAQVVVYAGAVMVLYVFVVAYVGGSGEPLTASTGASLRFASILFALALFVELTIALVGTALVSLDGDGAPYEAGFGTPEEVGELFLTRFLVAFELASLLLLIAAVGAVILARRRTGLPESGEISVGDIMRRPEVTPGEAAPGTMIEAASPPRR